MAGPARLATDYVQQLVASCAPDGSDVVGRLRMFRAHEASRVALAPADPFIGAVGSAIVAEIDRALSDLSKPLTA